MRPDLFLYQNMGMPLWLCIVLIYLGAQIVIAGVIIYYTVM